MHLMLADIPFPSFDPIAIHIGPLAVRWYGLAYLTGFVIAFVLLRRAAIRGTLRLAPGAVGDLLGWLAIGVMVGGRLGWWLVYDRTTGSATSSQPWWEPLAIWHGGMSFHGGLVGVVIALLLFARFHRVPRWNLADHLALVTPIGLFLGRLANFVNAELVGRPTTVPWGVVFPGDTFARHPSQLYEALLEGVVLGTVMWTVFAVVRRRRDGDLALLFLGLYGCFRFAVEFTRQPDAQVGFIAFGWLTMGQLLSAAMPITAVVLWLIRRRRTDDDEPSNLKPAATAVALLLMAVMLGGCTSESDSHLLSRLSREMLTPVEPTTSAAPPATRPAELADNAGPADYVRLALASNPRITAAAAKARRMAARVPQARALDDPMLTVTPIGEMAETAAGQVEAMAGISQKLPLPQKLNARADVARQETAAAVAELARVRLEVAADTSRAFWRYWLADRAIDVTRRSRDLLADLRESATAQLRAGRAGQADVLRAATELASLDNQLIDLQLDREVAAAALNRLIDRSPTTPLPDPPDVQPAEIDGTLDALDALLAKAAARNPRLAVRTAEIAAARQRQRLARLDDWPDLTVIGSYALVGDDGLASAANGDDQWSIGFGINLPVYREKRRAAVREQTAAVLEGLARLDTELNDVAYEVREAAAAVEAQRRLVELFDATVIPQARQTVDATAAAYRAGNTDFLSYVDAWRRLLDFELSERRARSDLGGAIADLRLALGTPAEPAEMESK